MKCKCTCECKKEVKEVWPKVGDRGYIVLANSGIHTSIAIYYDNFKNPLGFYKTKEDAQIMHDWYKAQVLDWMPNYEEWWLWFGDCYTSDENPSYGITNRGYISSGNVHKTKEDAMEYGKLIEKVGEIKRKYYKLKHGL